MIYQINKSVILEQSFADYQAQQKTGFAGMKQKWDRHQNSTHTRDEARDDSDKQDKVDRDNGVTIKHADGTNDSAFDKYREMAED